jgi:hypothetical protein
MVHWMRRWLAGVDRHVEDPEMRYWKEAELQCTPRGQVLLESGERSVYDLNAELAAELAAQRRQRWSGGPPPGVCDEICQRIGARPVGELPKRQTRTLGTLQRDGFRIERLVLEAEGQSPLPGLRFVPDKPSGAVALVLDGDGKAAQVGPAIESKPDAQTKPPESGTVAERLVREGTIVLAVDLSGFGETAVGPPTKPLAAEWKEFFLAYLMGRSLVGLRAEEIWSAATWAANEHRPPSEKIALVALGHAVVPALHAAALQPDLFDGCRLVNGLDSWDSIVGKPSGEHLPDVVHGALGLYDLPDLRTLLGDRLCE